MKKSLALLSIAWAPAFAQTFGDWSVGINAGGDAYMAVSNDSGSLLEKYCDISSSACYWIIFSTNPCVEKAQLPALVNTTTTASAATLTCWAPLPIAKVLYYRYILSDPDRIDSLVTNSNKFSIAFAMEGDAFRVLRFNTAQAPSAIEQLKTAFAAARQKKPSGTKDLTL